jgi:chitosanase
MRRQEDSGEEEENHDEAVAGSSQRTLTLLEMDLTDLFCKEKKRIIQSVLSVFETGKTEPDYGAVVVLDDGAGITYGKHQSTDGGESSLDKIVLRYMDRAGTYTEKLAPYVELLAEDATADVDPKNLPRWVTELMIILKVAADDPIMQEAQDSIFDEHYWNPAASQAEDMKLVYPLSWLVCYDSTIHSGVNGISNIRRRFAEMPPSRGGDEKEWVFAYLHARRNWLISSSRSIVRATVYRIDAMLDMLHKSNWDLNVPIIISKPRAVIE